MKNSINLLVLAFLLLFYGCNQSTTAQKETQNKPQLAISDSLKWSERMALSIMKRHPEAWQIDDKEEIKWDYVHGLVLTAFDKLYQTTQNQNYYNYLRNYADTLIESSGNIKTYKLEDYNIDMLNAGKILFTVYEKEKQDKYLKALQLLRKQITEHPRTKSGGFWHKKRYPNQMWLDGLYMGAPFYAQYNSVFEQNKNIDDVIKQFDLMQKAAFDKNTGLLFHGWDESKLMQWADKKTGCSPNFWSRSLGWYAMALVDVLDYVPAENAGHQRLVGYLNSLAEALVNYQDESGLWYQVTNYGNKDGNYLEASGSSMFCYALAKGANKNYLDKKYMLAAEKAFDGITSKLIKIDEDGEIHLTQVCAVAGLGGDPYRDGSVEYYINEKKKDNDPKGTGPFILAALELNK